MIIKVLRNFLAVFALIGTVIRLALTIRYPFQEGFGDHIVKAGIDFFRGKSTDNLSEKLFHLEELAHLDKFKDNPNSYLGQKFAKYKTTHKDATDKDFKAHYIRQLLRLYTIEDLALYDTKQNSHFERIKSFRKTLFEEEGSLKKNTIQEISEKYFNKKTDKETGTFLKSLLCNAARYKPLNDVTNVSGDFLAKGWGDKERPKNDEVQLLLKEFIYGPSGRFASSKEIGANFKKLISDSKDINKEAERRKLRLLFTLFDTNYSVGTRLAAVIDKEDLYDTIADDGLWKSNFEKLQKLSENFAPQEPTLKKHYLERIKKVIDEKYKEISTEESVHKTLNNIDTTVRLITEAIAGKSFRRFMGITVELIGIYFAVMAIAGMTAITPLALLAIVLPALVISGILISAVADVVKNYYLDNRAKAYDTEILKQEEYLSRTNALRLNLENLKLKLSYEQLTENKNIIDKIEEILKINSHTRLKLEPITITPLARGLLLMVGVNIVEDGAHIAIGGINKVIKGSIAFSDKFNDLAWTKFLPSFIRIPLDFVTYFGWEIFAGLILTIYPSLTATAAKSEDKNIQIMKERVDVINNRRKRIAPYESIEGLDEAIIYLRTHGERELKNLMIELNTKHKIDVEYKFHGDIYKHMQDNKDKGVFTHKFETVDPSALDGISSDKTIHDLTTPLIPKEKFDTFNNKPRAIGNAIYKVFVIIGLVKPYLALYDWIFNTNHTPKVTSFELEKEMGAASKKLYDEEIIYRASTRVTKTIERAGSSAALTRNYKDAEPTTMVTNFLVKNFINPSVAAAVA